MPPRTEPSTLAGLGEAGIIARLASFPATRPDVVRGIGDDCAVFREPDGSALLVTTDALIEGVHFRRDWSPAASIGHKALAVNLSDVAAMGGEPVAAFLAFSAPSDLPVAWLDDFAGGLRDLASRAGVDLAGGDTTGSTGPLALCLTVLGRAPMRAVRYRDGARPGDRVAVSGTLGDAALAVHLLQQGRPCPARLRRRLEWPEPRLALGRALGAHAGCTALMDLSDGLTTDLPRMASASGVGVRLEVDRVPLSADLLAACGGDRARALSWALAGGDDYELLAACRPDAELESLTIIGEFVEGSGMTCVDGQGRETTPPRRGFAHFGEGA